MQIRIAKLTNGRIIVMGDSFQTDQENFEEIKEVSENICINQNTSIKIIETKEIKIK